MTNHAKSRPPPAPDDGSSVRERAPSYSSITPTSAAGTRERAPSYPSIAPPGTGSASAARDRLEGKLRTARGVLGTLSAADDRARLLHLAIVRRDEALLDGVLGALGVVTGTNPPSGR